MAAVADFNSGNMLLTPTLSIFTARMTLLLNHLKHPVKPAACEMHVKMYQMAPTVIIFAFSLQERFTTVVKEHTAKETSNNCHPAF